MASKAIMELCGGNAVKGPCQRPAGWGTNHRGTGRCMFHEQAKLVKAQPSEPASRQPKEYDWKSLFLEHYACTGHMARSAKAAGVSHRMVEYAVRCDPEFREQFQEARRAMVAVLEDEALRRAVEGVERNVYYKGEKVDTYREFSDTLLIRLLQANCPERYREHVSVAGSVGVEHSGTVASVTAIALAEWAKLPLGERIRELQSQGSLPIALPAGSDLSPEGSASLPGERPTLCQSVVLDSGPEGG